MIGSGLTWLARLARWSIVGVALLGCSKSGGGDAPDAGKATSAVSASASTSPASAGGSASATAGSAGSAAGTPSAGAGAYDGKYSTAPSTYYIPTDKDWKSVKPAPDDTSKFVGEGTMSLAIDGAGRIQGTIDSGPASPAVIEGTLVDSDVRAQVRRKDPSDEGLSGVLSGKLSGAAVEGTLKLSLANASVLREGKLSLKKK
jgi:hypothetical protein